MFKFLVICAVVAAVAAVEKHESSDVHAETIKNYSDVRADGFEYVEETNNGIYAAASGDENGNIHGEYHWQSNDGVPVHISYVADENGYQPQSDLLPTPPPTPEAILKALAYLSAHGAK